MKRREFILIRCCFGVDDGPNPEIRNWFAALPLDEQKRRREFADKFKKAYTDFRNLPLSTTRNVIEHRTGVPPVTVTVTSLLGITYLGGPINPIPMSEVRELPPNAPPGVGTRPIPVHPSWDDFKIDDKPLFATCREYLDNAVSLAAQARTLADGEHGNAPLASPPV